MRPLRFAALLISATTAAFAQQWEFGASAGGGFLDHVTASSPAGSATAGFATPAVVVGAFAGDNLYRYISGEFHYEFMQSELRLTSGGQSAQFSGVAHAFHFDLLFHSPNTSRVQVFGAIGGGGKEFIGTGAEEASQPLSQFGYFTKTQSFRGLLTASGGVTCSLGAHVLLRAEVRDYMTTFPTAVLTPPPGVKYGNWLNELLPMVSIVFRK